VPIYLPIAELCNDNYLKKQQEIQTQAINLAQNTLVFSYVFIYCIKKKEGVSKQAKYSLNIWEMIA
jgi:hypothetical protein